jgi:hypothetical protein
MLPSGNLQKKSCKLSSGQCSHGATVDMLTDRPANLSRGSARGLKKFGSNYIFLPTQYVGKFKLDVFFPSVFSPILNLCQPFTLLSMFSFSLFNSLVLCSFPYFSSLVTCFLPPYICISFREGERDGPLGLWMHCGEYWTCFV